MFYFYVLLTRGISALLIQMAFKNFTTQVVEGTLQMIEDEMFVEVFRPEHHGRVHGYGDGVNPTELWGSSVGYFRMGPFTGPWAV